MEEHSLSCFRRTSTKLFLRFRFVSFWWERIAGLVLGGGTGVGEKERLMFFSNQELFKTINQQRSQQTLTHEEYQAASSHRSRSISPSRIPAPPQHSLRAPEVPRQPPTTALPRAALPAQLYLRAARTESALRHAASSRGRRRGET